MESLSSSMLEKAKEVQKNAYAVYSHFSVGACLVTIGGQLFVGCNVENASYGLTQCAEANAIAAMVAGGEKEIQEILIYSNAEDTPPCGACLQKIQEFSNEQTVVHWASPQGLRKSLLLKKLLPYPFKLSAE